MQDSRNAVMGQPALLSGVVDPGSLRMTGLIYPHQKTVEYFGHNYFFAQSAGWGRIVKK